MEHTSESRKEELKRKWTKKRGGWYTI